MTGAVSRTASPGGTGAAPPVLQVHDVTKTFRIHHERAKSLKQFIAARARNRYETFYALRDVDFEVREGEAVGVIGHNGSGKSTLLKCMAGILRPNAGSIAVHRRMAALLELGAGFTPELSGRDNVFLNASILGMSRRDIARRFDAIVEFSGLERFIDSPVLTYSSGMYVRLAFAVAINVDPELLLIDEILAVGDVTFQQKCFEKFVEFREQGRTLVLVTHDMTSVRDFCDRALWLEHGRISGEGDPTELVDAYTESMLGGEREGEAAAVRRGPGPIQVERVELLVDGRSVARCRTGDDVTVRLHVASSETVRSPVFAVTVARFGGAVVTQPSTRDAGVVPTSVTGAAVVDVHLPDVRLLPGRYVLHTEVTGFTRQHLYDHLQNAFVFDVMHGTTKETEGLITMRPDWDVSGPGVV